MIYAIYIAGPATKVDQIPGNETSKIGEYHRITEDENEAALIIELIAPNKAKKVLDIVEDQGNWKGHMPVHPDTPREHTQMFYALSISEL